jgi:hypothetical protein
MNGTTKEYLKIAIVVLVTLKIVNNVQSIGTLVS